MNQAEATVWAVLGAGRAVEARLEGVLAPHGLSLAKVGLLRLLATAGEPVALSELAQHANCVRSNITQLVDRLEKDGLVRRRPDPADRRSVRAALTPAGERAYAKGSSALAAEHQVIVGALGAADRTALLGALEAFAR